MLPLKVTEIIKATGGKLICGMPTEVVTDITTDSRKAASGSLFAAICGERADGHDYIDQVFEKGAVCVLSEKEITADGAVILVENTVAALGKVARLVMEKLCVPVVGITGSVGKTTTRDMTYSVVSKIFSTLKNEGNLNNELGVPLTVFRADESTEAVVMEMGMDNFGEIDRLSSIVMPSVSVITNIGMSHIEKLGSQENIYLAKSEIFKNTRSNGTAVLNGDDKILMAHKDEIPQKVVTVGVKNQNADLVAYDIKSTESEVSFVAKGMGREFSVKLPVPGEHNVLNALLAAAVGIVYEIPSALIAEALSDFSMTKMRMDIIRTERLVIINDCYNAAPDSVRAALSVLSKYDQRKVAILGDIKALGEYSYKAHKDLGLDVVQNGIDVLITIGEQASHIAQGANECGMDSSRIFSAMNIEEAQAEIIGLLKANDVVLVKASRAMALEKITEFLKENF